MEQPQVRHYPSSVRPGSVLSGVCAFSSGSGLLQVHLGTTAMRPWVGVEWRLLGPTLEHQVLPRVGSAHGKWICPCPQLVREHLPSVWQFWMF